MRKLLFLLVSALLMQTAVQAAKLPNELTEFVKNGGILTGTKVPVILTSRSDTFETKVNSIALAAVVAEELKKNQ